MPCCGLTIDFLYERLKAAEAEGSEVATQLLDDFLSIQDSQPEGAEAAAGQANVKDTSPKMVKGAVKRDSKLLKEE
jgi:hypothetical protein